jgi:hypothetical protein
MTKTKLLTSLMLLSGTSIVAGCDSGAQVGTQVGDQSAEVDSIPPPVAVPGVGSDVSGRNVLGPTFTESALAAHGGGGGTFTGHVTPAAVIYAVQANSGSEVDHIRFAWYQPTNAGNHYQTGNALGTTAIFGGNGGAANAWFSCPIGPDGFQQGVIGIRGASGSLLDRIGVVCGNVNTPDPNDPFNSFSPLWGGGGGGFFDDRCSPGRLMDSFNVRSGSLVDNLQGICINAH